MNRRRGALALLLLALAASLPAHAFPGGRQGGWMQVRENPQAPHRDRGGRGDRGDRGDRDFAPQRRDYSDPQGPQRMTPDERRQLRRDLRDAGRDIYPQRRDGRR